MQTALNGTIKKLASDNETTRHNFREEVTTLKEEKWFLQEKLDRVLGRVREVVDELTLLKKVVAQWSTSSPSTFVGTLPTS